MAEGGDGQQPVPDFVQLWRDWMTESERQFNTFLTQVMGSTTSARALGTSAESYAALQSVVADAMQRYLQFMNMPTRADVVSLGEALRSIEERLARIEETLQIAAEAVDASERPAPAREEPPRTRRPASFLPSEVASSVGVPDEFRR